jgi:hypothetical protein
VRHLRERTGEIAQFQPRLLLGRRRRLACRGVGRGPGPAAQVVDMDVVQDGEEPGAQIAAGPPQMRPREGPRQAVLHEVLCIAGIAQQAAGVAAQRHQMIGQRGLERRRGSRVARAPYRDRHAVPFHAPDHIAGCPVSISVYTYASAAVPTAPCVKNRAEGRGMPRPAGGSGQDDLDAAILRLANAVGGGNARVFLAAGRLDDRFRRHAQRQETLAHGIGAML